MERRFGNSDPVILMETGRKRKRNPPETQTVSTGYRKCEYSCSIDVHVEDGNPVNVKGRKVHPFNRR